MSDSGWDVVIGIAGLIVNGVGLGFVAVQVALARRQSSEAQASKDHDLLLRRKEATIQHLANTERTKRQYRSLLPDDFDQAAVAAFVAEVIAGEEAAAQQALLDYLGYWETFALGARLGVYDIETVCRMSGARISAVCDGYGRYIRHRRASTGVETLFEELDWLNGEAEAYRLSRGIVRRQAVPGAPRQAELEGA